MGRRLSRLSPAHSEQVVEFWRALLATHDIQVKLNPERDRLSVVQAGRASGTNDKLHSAPKISIQ